MMESIKKLREMTGAGMMDVKKALGDAGGDEDKAVALLRERGIVKAAKKADREAKEGLIVFRISPDKKKGALIEVNSETDFVARNSDFQQLVANFADALLASGAADLEAFKQSALEGETVESALAAAAGRIGENLVLNRAVYVETDGVIGGYVHNNGKIGVLVDLMGGSEELAKDIALHIAAERPRYLKREEVNADDIEKEREILTNKALNEGKPQNIVDKIVGGQISKFYEENVLLEQKFVKDNTQTISALLTAQGGAQANLKRFVRFEVGA
ncbi:translation elongation factor Ts [Deinococcus peraridilitoris]|uniref:Elongation factor Ts n=1 Tax=Deinococcus peraridilitoris (strain DSM 19664 / LMG 22246 / CIP 109416 / KR-200) TaxID=937777 RepID=L0A727_DEIPD|nr:translation elongation factor Ts [Deinococcus peraridilitoris]AFZ68860.1 translation elongation factor Ts [Deinococcus peraridilitoris DSM 19664]